MSRVTSKIHKIALACYDRNSSSTSWSRSTAESN